jgi:predicted ATPase
MNYSQSEIEKLKKSKNDYYILTDDNWNDYGYNTTFNVRIIKDGELYEGMRRKILFDNQDEIDYSFHIFSQFNSKSSTANIEEVQQQKRYISLGHDYKELKKIFIKEDFNKILKALNDVIYLEEEGDPHNLLTLKEHSAFEISLGRDQSAKKLLSEGSALLYGSSLSQNRFKFDFDFKLNENDYKYKFDFVKNELPYRINLLIGKNGSGKSQSLKVLSEYFINRKKSKDEYNISISDKPDFIANTIVFAYNPYENFHVPRYNGKGDYKYLGFRRYQKIYENLNLGKLNSIENGLSILYYMYENIDSKIKKLLPLNAKKLLIKKNELINIVIESNQNWDIKDIEKVLNLYIATIENIVTDVHLPDIITKESCQYIYKRDIETLSKKVKMYDKAFINLSLEFIRKAIPEIIGYCFKLKDDIQTDIYDAYDFESIKFDSNKKILTIKELHNDEIQSLPNINFDDFKAEFYFMNEKEKFLKLSSGQKVFSNLIINLLSMIEENSLVIIDEPENTLHPNLEIDFMKILKSILKEFKSFAIVATHSATITREIPKDFVHIIKVNKENIPRVVKPTINTFGSNIGTITNYIFDDVFVDEKPYQAWLEKQKSKFNTFSEFEENFSGQLSYDFLMTCYNNWSHQSD